MAAPPKKPTSASPRKQQPPSSQALKHANKITHRAADGTFKQPPTLKSKQPPAIEPPDLPYPEDFLNPDPPEQYPNWDDDEAP